MNKESCRAAVVPKEGRDAAKRGRASEEGSPSSSTKKRKIDVVIPIDGTKSSTATSPLLPTSKKTTEEAEKMVNPLAYKQLWGNDGNNCCH